MYNRHRGSLSGGSRTEYIIKGIILSILIFLFFYSLEDIDNDAAKNKLEQQTGKTITIVSSNKYDGLLPRAHDVTFQIMIDGVDEKAHCNSSPFTTIECSIVE